MKFTKEEVEHVANLARLELTDEEIKKYQLQLSDILKEIDKILKVDIKEDDILITTTKNSNVYITDNYSELLTKEEVLKNANNKDLDYIIVPEVIE